MVFMGKSTISKVIFHSYIKLPEDRIFENSETHIYDAHLQSLVALLSRIPHVHMSKCQNHPKPMKIPQIQYQFVDAHVFIICKFRQKSLAPSCINHKKLLSSLLDCSKPSAKRNQLSPAMTGAHSKHQRGIPSIDWKPQFGIVYEWVCHTIWSIKRTLDSSDQLHLPTGSPRVSELLRCCAHLGKLQPWPM